MTDRLLTDEEILEATSHIDMNPVTYDTRTLKAVGEWLDEWHDYPHLFIRHTFDKPDEPTYRMRRANCPECFWQLKQGKMPNGH